MAAPCPLLAVPLGDGITDDTLLHIARLLPSATDLLSLGLTCPRFAARIIAAPGVIAAGGQHGQGPAAAPEMLSIVEETARLWLAGCTEQECGWVSRRELESWLGLMHEVGLLRVPLAFGRAHGNFTLSEGGAVATKNAGGYSWRKAASKVVMRSRRHFACFTVEGGLLVLGLIRPGWDLEEGEEVEDVDGHCFYRTFDGRHLPGRHDWQGMQGAREQGDRIGMLLDLDQGSMTIWKNDG